MGALLRAAGALDRIARFVGKLAGWMIIPLIAVIMFDVVTRKIDITRLYFSDFSIEYGYSISTILQDLQWHFHAVLLLLTFGLAYLANAHVRVDIFREMASRRGQAWIELVGLVVLAIPFLSLMIYYSFLLAELSYQQGEGSESLTGIPERWFIKSFMGTGFVVLMLAVLATVVRLAALLFGGEAEKAQALDGLEIFADDHEELERARLAAERALRENGGSTAPDAGGR